MHSNTFLARLNWFDYKLFHATLSVHRNSIKRLTLFDKDEYLGLKVWISSPLAALHWLFYLKQCTDQL